MVDPDDRLLRDLARLRERSGPPVGAEQRVHAALNAAIGPGPGGGGHDGGSASDVGESSIGQLGDQLGGQLGSGGLGASKLALASKVVLTTVAVTSVGLLVNLGVTRARPSREVETPPVTIAATTSIEEPSSIEKPEPESEPPIVVTPRAKPPAPVQRPSERDEDPLTAEVTLLEQARATDDLAVRLELLEQHRTRFEDGLFAAERESLRISTLCELGQLELARRAAEKFLLAHPRSPLRLRMRSACPEIDILAD
jgi:hypothetical protein